MSSLKIGITERGDAGLDLSWQRKLPYVSGAVLITKNLNARFRKALLESHAQGHPLILHAGCTGWGGSALEPNVPKPANTVDALARLVRDGFPLERCVLRIDPIVPTEAGIGAARRTLALTRSHPELDGIRVRVSVLDEYRHVKRRLVNAGFAPFYGPERFQADDNEMRKVADALAQEHDEHGHIFETCAEPRLSGPAVRRSGCISADDVRLMGIQAPTAMLGSNPQNRHGCLCLSCKTELLDRRRQCPHKCLYCYWKS